MFLGLRDAYSRAHMPVHFYLYSYYPKRDAEIAAPLNNVTVHAGHPVDIALQLLPAILLRNFFSWALPQHWRKAADDLAGCDVVLLIGGTTFADSMWYKVPWNVLAALPAYLLKRPVLFLSQTIGPLHNAFNRLCAKWTFRRARHVHGRGKTSARYAAELDVCSASYWPDLSFSMDVPSWDSLVSSVPLLQQCEDFITRLQRRPVGICPNTIVLDKCRKKGIPYISFLRDIITELFDRGYAPILIPHSYRPLTTGMHNNDRALCKAVLEGLPKEIGIFYVDADLNSRQLRSLVGRLHLLIASRFHSMVSALSQGVPPITYGWGNQKYLEVLEEFGVPDLCVPADQMNKTAFKTTLDIVEKRYNELSARIKKALPEIIQHSDCIPSEIKKYLNSLTNGNGHRQ